MKKIILLFAAIITFTATHAQENKTQKVDAATKATAITNKMVKELALTDAQKAKAEVINLETVKLMELNQQTNGSKPNEFEVEKQRISKKWDTDILTVITQAQLEHWKKFQADEKAKK